MTIRQQIFAVIVTVAMFALIIYLVKERKLKEEYSWLWLVTGAFLLVLVLYYDILKWFTKLIGAVLPTTTLFLFGIIFLIFFSLHFAIKVSLLQNQIKNLAQKVSLLEADLEDRKG
ncbi:MAG: DUF2304 domain-containing protein [Syntrophobacterales bacterium]|nr:DUF2304 domain-containing protein [Syntrophobacterales bacterium]